MCNIVNNLWQNGESMSKGYVLRYIAIEVLYQKCLQDSSQGVLEDKWLPTGGSEPDLGMQY